MSKPTELRLFNTLSRKKENFSPIDPGKVGIYVCGVTVYDYCHIGHARAYVTFDCIRRTLEAAGYEVRYIQNFTDIDDKIITKAKQVGEDAATLASRYIDAYFEDMDALGVLRATAYPKATESIDKIIAIITDLVNKGTAYEVDGDVIFQIDTKGDYGKLSKKVLAELQAGARVDTDDKKKNPLDFVLWKAAKPDEPAWDSPWGKGRPGWHIECTAMATTCLGDTIDIHGGGEDLIFPHHENEICQSEAYTEKPFANYWIHNGFVNIRNEKMSKSKKNFVTVRNLLKTHTADAIRFFLLKVHYRMPLAYAEAHIIEAQQALDRLKTAVRNAPDTLDSDDTLERYESSFLAAIFDDFNFPKAIGELFQLAKHVNQEGRGKALLVKLAGILGLGLEDSESTSDAAAITSLIQARKSAKLAKNYTEADRIRDQLLQEFNVQLEDTKEGVRWHYLS